MEHDETLTMVLNLVQKKHVLKVLEDSAFVYGMLVEILVIMWGASVTDWANRCMESEQFSFSCPAWQHWMAEHGDPSDLPFVGFSKSRLMCLITILHRLHYQTTALLQLNFLPTQDGGAPTAMILAATNAYRGRTWTFEDATPLIYSIFSTYERIATYSYQVNAECNSVFAQLHRVQFCHLNFPLDLFGDFQRWFRGE
jgi:hypothetical protein